MTESEKSPSFGIRRRWYDHSPELAHCVATLESFPPEIQDIVADGLVYLVEREFDAHKIMFSLRSLGAEKILSIYKSKQKRRRMDSTPRFHQTMNYFFILTPANRMLMAKLTQDLIQCICKYLESCKDYGHPVSAEEVSQITKTFIENGGEAAERFVEEMQRQFQMALRRVRDGMPKIRDDGASMEIRKEEPPLPPVS